MIRPTIRSLKRAIAGVLVVLMLVQTTGCSSWMTVSTSVATVESSKHKVKVVLKEGGSVTTDSVRLRRDTLTTYQSGRPGEIPLDRVSEFKVRRSSTGNTVGLILGIGAALLAGLIALGLATMDDT